MNYSIGLFILVLFIFNMFIKPPEPEVKSISTTPTVLEVPKQTSSTSSSSESQQGIESSSSYSDSSEYFEDRTDYDRHNTNDLTVEQLHILQNESEACLIACKDELETSVAAGLVNGECYCDLGATNFPLAEAWKHKVDNETN